MNAVEKEVKRLRGILDKFIDDNPKQKDKLLALQKRIDDCDNSDERWEMISLITKELNGEINQAMKDIRSEVKKLDETLERHKLLANTKLN